MLLESGADALAPAMLEPLGERRARVTLDEGRYHQVRRMLRRRQSRRANSSALPSAAHTWRTAAGQWRVLTADERALLSPPKAP
jgi:16S rRNA pseudouridine516 synthase